MSRKFDLRILCNFDRDYPYAIIPYHVLFSVCSSFFDIIFLFICITCVTYNQNLEIIALFTDLNISIFLYCRVHRDLSVCLSGEGMLLLIMNVENMNCVKNVYLSVCT